MRKSKGTDPKAVVVRKLGGSKKHGPKTLYDQCTEKEKAFLAALFSTETNFVAYKAYLAAYPGISIVTAKCNGYRLYKQLIPIIQQILDELGLTREHLKMKLLELLNANETRLLPYIKKTVKREKVDGKWVVTTSDDQVITEKEVKALSIQVKALELAMKSQGMLSEKSTREVDQIDELIEIELAKLAAAGQAGPVRKITKKDQPDKANG